MKVADAKVLLKMVQVLADEMDREVPLTFALVFLRVASAGAAGVDQGRLMDDLVLSSSGASRTVQALSHVHWKKDREGLNLIERVIDPVDNRRRALRVTQKGERLIARVLSKADGG